MAKRPKDDDEAVPSPVYVSLRVAALANACRNPHPGADEWQRADLTEEQLAAERAAWVFLGAYLSAFSMAPSEVPTDGKEEAEEARVAGRRKRGTGETMAGDDAAESGKPA